MVAAATQAAPVLFRRNMTRGVAVFYETAPSASFTGEGAARSAPGVAAHYYPHTKRKARRSGACAGPLPRTLLPHASIPAAAGSAPVPPALLSASSAPVPLPPEVEVEVEDAALKDALEPLHSTRSRGGRGGGGGGAKGLCHSVSSPLPSLRAACPSRQPAPRPKHTPCKHASAAVHAPGA